MNKLISKGKGTGLLLFFTFLLFISLVGTISAVAPVTSVAIELNTGLNIDFPKFEEIEQDENFLFHFHVFNISNGVRMDNSTVNCSFELYNSGGEEQLEVDNLEYISGDWRINVSGSNFTRLGNYAYLVECHTETLGGFISFPFKVTPTGLSSNLGFYVLILILSFGIIIFGATRNDPVITMLGSFGLYFLALYILFNGIVGVKDLITTWAIGIILLGFAMYASIKSAHSLITD